jgi:hypothetical protein
MIIDSIILDIRILIISAEVLLVEVEQTPVGLGNSRHELPFMAEEH